MKALFLIAAIAATTLQAQAKMYYFKDFEADFPTQPKVRYTSAATFRMTQYAADSPYYALALFKYEYSSEIDAEERKGYHASLDRDKAIDNVLEVEYGTFQGFPAMSTTYAQTIHNRRVFTTNLYIYASRAVFLLNCMAFSEHREAAKAAILRLTNSLTIHQRQAAPPEIRPAIPVLDTPEEEIPVGPVRPEIPLFKNAPDA